MSTHPPFQSLPPPHTSQLTPLTYLPYTPPHISPSTHLTSPPVHPLTYLPLHTSHISPPIHPITYLSPHAHIPNRAPSISLVIGRLVDSLLVRQEGIVCPPLGCVTPAEEVPRLSAGWICSNSQFQQFNGFLERGFSRPSNIRVGVVEPAWRRGGGRGKDWGGEGKGLGGGGRIGGEGEGLGGRGKGWGGGGGRVGEEEGERGRL